MDTVASLRTDQASRYLSMMCQHFARRLVVTCDDRAGRVEFPFGECAMTVDDQSLQLVASASNRGDLDKVENVIASHLERFAFRENPEIEWRPSSNPSTESDLGNGITR